jgi:cell wall-associated NlpC family hydrolase
MNSLLRYVAYTLFFVFFILSCSTGPVAAKSGTAYRHASQYDTKSVAAVLYKQLAEWKGVRHRDGGLDKSGVDCSGFVYLTLWKHFGLKVPRTTKDLSRYGKAVSRRRLAPGDLVFFKTGLFKQHVGIYVEDGKFIHASASRGVMLSDMEDNYWTRRYWKARRVLKMKA